MTLGEGKQEVLKLLDEYSTAGAITPDEDINLKMNQFFNIAQRDMAGWQPILRRAVVALTGSGHDPLPADVSQVLYFSIGGRRTPKYEVVDGKIYYAAGDTSELTLDYIANPAPIPSDAPDDYEFEISEEAANCMPMFVAAQQMIPDLVIDYSKFYNIYLQMRSTVPHTRHTGNSGRIRQALYSRRS